MRVAQIQRSKNGLRRPTARGFTLVELMVTVAVLAILLGVAAPSFTSMTRRNRLTAAANELVATLQLAKMEAIRRNSRVVLCPSTDGSACSGGDWSRLIVFVDASGNGDKESSETVVRDVAIVRSGSGVTASGGTVNRIGFGPTGRVRFGSTATTGAVELVSSQLPASDSTRRVEMAASRISVCNPSGTPSCS